MVIFPTSALERVSRRRMLREYGVVIPTFMWRGIKQLLRRTPADADALKYGQETPNTRTL